MVVGRVGDPWYAAFLSGGYRIARSTIYHRHFSPESKHGFHLVADNILKTAIVEIVVVIEDCRRPKLIG